MYVTFINATYAFRGRVPERHCGRRFRVSFNDVRYRKKERLKSGAEVEDTTTMAEVNEFGREMAFNEKAPSIIEVTTAVRTSEGAIQYLRVNGLLRSTCVCEKCGVAMGIMKTDCGDGEIFKCGNCYSKKSIRHGSFFEVSDVLVTGALSYNF